MTVFTIYANSNDHFIYGSSATYSTARAGSGLVDNTGGIGHQAGQQLAAGNYYVYQAFLSFDLSAVPAGTLGSSKLTLDTFAAHGSVAKTYWASEFAWSGGTSDFVAGASLSGLTGFGNRSFASGEATGAKDFTGPASLPRSSTYKLAVFAQDQRDNVAPASGVGGFIAFNAAEQSGTSQDPRITITGINYSMAAGAGSFTLAGNQLLTAGMNAGAGSFTLTGNAAALRGGKAVAAATGVFTLTSAGILFPILRDPPQGRTIIFERSSLDDTRTLTL